MYKLEFKLKQHTPIIHFQHDQDGATLRATELKPKLDRFLIEKYRSEVEPYIQKTSSQDQYLNYKIKINANKGEILNLSIGKNNVKNTYKTIDIPSYFGNMGETSDDKLRYALFTNSDIDLTIICLENVLLRLIKDKLPLFLLQTNFGTRQNKGFGSFYLSKEDENYSRFLPLESIKLVQPKGFYIEYRDKDYNVNDKMNIDLLNDINNIYNLMKRGFNFPDHPRTKVILTKDGEKKVPNLAIKGRNQMFYRSFLHSYWYTIQNPPKISNEKRFIKQKFFGKGSNKIDGANHASDWDNRQYNNFQFIRALLGVNDNYEFLLNNGKREKVSVKSLEVERYKSPITFKIIDNLIFILLDFDESILGKEFEFSFGADKERIFTPTNFDMKYMLSQFVEYYNNLDVDTENSANAVKSMVETLKIVDKIHSYA